jgi:hypothetical protein
MHKLRLDDLGDLMVLTKPFVFDELAGAVHAVMLAQANR